MAGIYVHIPFCKSKCRYCDFTSFTDKSGFMESYVACTCHEMAMWREDLASYKFDTLYIGGGTPSVVDESYIGLIIAAAKRYLNLKRNAEITIEMNPGTVTKEKIDFYVKCGVNRFSVGLQSAIDSQLEDLGRCHNLEQFEECARLLSGRNFNVDVMIGLKGQTLDDIAKTIEVAAASGASHVSMYALTPEEGTPIYTDYLNGELPDGDTVAEMYAFGVQKLKELGFNRYEVSNFCKERRESRHNLNYWRRGEYIGIGVSASSCIKNVRFTNTYDLDEYFKCILSNHYPVIDREKIDKQGMMDETVMLALRTVEGLDIPQFNMHYSCRFTKKYAEAIKKNEQYLEITEKRARIKDEYLFVQNSIICDFLS